MDRSVIVEKATALLIVPRSSLRGGAQLLAAPSVRRTEARCEFASQCLAARPNLIVGEKM